MARTMTTLAAALLGATGVNAQTITGTLTGVVKDASGGVLPGATITMVHVQTSRQETAVTNAEGTMDEQQNACGHADPTVHDCS